MIYRTSSAYWLDWLPKPRNIQSILFLVHPYVIKHVNFLFQYKQVEGGWVMNSDGKWSSLGDGCAGGVSDCHSERHSLKSQTRSARNQLIAKRYKKQKCYLVNSKGVSSFIYLIVFLIYTEPDLLLFFPHDSWSSCKSHLLIGSIW